MYKLHTKWVRENGGIVNTENGDDAFEIDTLLSYEGEDLKKVVEGNTY